MSPWVQRDEFGNVLGLYSNEQEFAGEWLDDDHADVVAFRERRGPPPPERWQISTYRVVRRIADAGKAVQGRAVLEADDEMFLRFLTVPDGKVWSDDIPLRQGIIACGLDPDVILAREEA